MTACDFLHAVFDPTVKPPTGLTDGMGHPAGRRFDIYRNNVINGLSDALETAFPILRKLLGQKKFRSLAMAFSRLYPPTTPIMMFYGSELPEFLTQFEPTRDIGYLPDMARLEIAFRESHHSTDARSVDADELRTYLTQALDDARIGLSPAVRMVQSSWPIHAIWRYNTIDNAPKPVMAAEDVFVARPELDVTPHLLPAGGYRFIESLLSGNGLGAATVDAMRFDNSFDLTKILTVLISTRSVTSIGT